MDRAISSVPVSGGASGPASKAKRTTTSDSVPTVEGKTSDWTEPPGRVAEGRSEALPVAAARSRSPAPKGLTATVTITAARAAPAARARSGPFLRFPPEGGRGGRPAPGCRT
ncbi:hypothetical protein ACIOWG_07620 [Streptomyces sp. NPDC087658]|uniref:hypothetical protein n=1 Tax=Streptomyces sp. NPDC087658 TaxID=3365800 RepID=UPI00382A4303